MSFILGFIVDAFPLQIANIPNHLEEVNRNEGMYIGGFLLLSFILIALSKRVSDHALSGFMKSFFGLSSKSKLEREDLDPSALSSILLTVNFLLCIGICIVLSIKSLNDFGLTDISQTSSVIIALSVVGLLIVYLALGLLIGSWVTGEKSYFIEPIIQTMNGANFMGLVLFFVALIWFLNPIWSKNLIYLFALVLAIFLIVRFIKGVTISLIQGVRWYYIILYFCTLEILPLFVAYYYVGKNFNV